MNTIDKIRAEIERRNLANYCGTAEQYEEELFAILDTLEEPVSEDLEDCLELNEAAEKFARLYDNGTCDGIAQDCFKAGAEWQKAKMMEGAVDVHIVKSYNPCTEEGKPTLHGVELLYEDEGKPYLVAGENARIVILPKEDEK